MNCPRCKTQLNEKAIKDINASFEVEYCNSCGGAWFDDGELSLVDKVSEPTFFEVKRIPGRKDQFEALSCPSCNNQSLLIKAEHPRDKKVILDYCPVCKGIWLDKGELEAIQRENWLITLRKVYKWLVSRDN